LLSRTWIWEMPRALSTCASVSGRTVTTSSSIVVRAFMFAVTTALAVASCGKPPQVVTKPGEGCPRPENVVISDQTIKVATGEIGEASVGGLEITNNTELVKILAEPDVAALIVNYLMCEAIQRGELKSTDTARVDYVRSMLTYLYSTRPVPTAQQYAEWLKQNPAPPRPTGKLELPDFAGDTGKFRFVMDGARLRKSFRILNAGDLPLTVWIANYQSDQLAFAPKAGPYDIAPHDSTETELLVVCCQQPDKLTMVIKTNIPSEATIDIQFPDPQAVQAKFDQLSRAFVFRLAKAKPDFAVSKDPPDEVMARLAFETVNSELPGLTEASAWRMSGSMLEASTWPQAAVEAYRAEGVASGNDGVVTEQLARAMYLSGRTPQTKSGADEYAKFLAREDFRPLKTVTFGPNQEVSSVNPLVSSTSKDELNAALRTLVLDDRLAQYSVSLKGDWYLASSKPTQAKQFYMRCARSWNTPVCQVKSLEAAGWEDPTNRKFQFEVNKFARETEDPIAKAWAHQAMEGINRGM
jgi:hypothetical protein